MREQQGEIRTIVVDDYPAALRAVCSMVVRQPNLSLVGAASNARDALALATSLRPDLVLLDLDMPVMDGLEVAGRLGRDCPGVRVVIVTMHDSPELRKLCTECGASGFIPKEVLKDRLPILVRSLFGDWD